MEKIKIGKIVNAVALRGEVKVYAYSEQKGTHALRDPGRTLSEKYRHPQAQGCR